MAALQEYSKPVVKLRLYVVAGTANSDTALSAVKAFVAASTDRADISLEIVDVFSDPSRALMDRVLVTPTLCVSRVNAEHRCIGIMSASDLAHYVLGGIEI